MTTRAVAEIDDWDTVPFGGGYAGLRDLADGGFSGVVQAGPAKLCLLKGTPVGVLDGTIEDFEDAAGTAYEAPSPALPLLALMQARGDEVRAEYYTEETPISEVDRTLSDGGFSGYIELSDNVLSGDYYVVYHAGRSMAVAWVGNMGELLTDDEAFRRADDEVGIYQVRQVDVEPVEIPGPSGGSDAGAAGAGAGGATSGGSTAGASTVGASDAAGDSDDATGETEPSTETTTAGAATDESETETATAPETTAENPTSRAGDATATETTDTGTHEAGDTSDAETETADTEANGPDRVRKRASAGQSRTAGSRESTDGHDTGDGTAAPVGRLETRSIPSLDPERTSDDRETDATDAGAAATAGTAAAGSRSTPGGEDDTRPESDSDSGIDTASSAAESSTDRSSADTGPETAGGTASESSESSPTDRSSEPDAPSTGSSSPADSSGGAAGSTGTSGGSRAASSERVAELEVEVEEREAEIERLESELASVRGEREELREERDRLVTERDELAAEVDRLESRLNEFETEFGGAIDAERQLSPSEALDGTNLFVRYGSKGKATLESAHSGTASREDVTGNLDLEHHTQFEGASASVGGQSFEAFFRDTLQYRFVSWVVEDLIYEIRDTGRVAALQDLYDAIPEIDRAELDGTVTVEFTEDGQEKHAEESFDVVLRDRMGNPLVVANLNDSREATTESMMRSLVEASSRVSESNDSLAAAVFVTSSFFEPEALETADASTGHGRFSRDKRESFVKHSRNRGYHLCLVEARDGQFHLAVPDL